jgi:hypothetical protein
MIDLRDIGLKMTANCNLPISILLLFDDINVARRPARARRVDRV